jgi:hypothetical protein
VTTDHWSARYVGIPWADGGCSLAGVDCWGVCVLPTREVRGVELPALRYESARDPVGISPLFAIKNTWPFRRVRLGEEREFDIAVYQRAGRDTHAALVTGPGEILEIDVGGSTHVARMNHPSRRLRLSGVYRHCALEAPLQVLAMPHFDPRRGRAELDVAYGSTVAAIVAGICPSLTDVQADHLLVVPQRLVDGDWVGTEAVPRAMWAHVRPAPGTRVVLRPRLGNNLRTILGIIVSIAALTLATVFGGPLGTALGLSAFTASGLITAGVTIIGMLLINAFVPLKGPDKRKDVYTIAGWSNQALPDAPVPAVLGYTRFSPPYAALPFTEVIGDDMWVTAAFLFGYGPLVLSEHRFGDTLISDVPEADILMEVRQGYAGDAPMALYPQQIIQENYSTVLEHDKGKDPIKIVHRTARDITEASIDITFPSGLVEINDNGDKESHSMSISVEQCLIDTPGDWVMVESHLVFEAKKLEPFTRTYRWPFAVRGTYDIRVTRLDEIRNQTTIQEQAAWTALRSYRPEYPFNFPFPVSLVTMKVKATKRLNGAVDNYNALVSRICPDWDYVSQTWIDRETTSPAALARWIKQGPAKVEPLTDDEIDLAGLQDLHDYCRLNGLHYNAVHDQDQTEDEALAAVLSAGRAIAHDDGEKWGVIIDRPRTRETAHITPRNSWGFSWERTYVDPPDALRVQFRDETNKWEQAERIVPWIGFTGDPEVVEQIELPGKTSPDEVWREARRRMYETQLRSIGYTASQDWEVLEAARGSLVRLSNDKLDAAQVATRVRSVTGRAVELDDIVTMVDGENYAIRFRTLPATADEYAATDVISSLWSVRTVPGESAVVLVEGGTTMPQLGDLAMFGIATRETREVLVRDFEAGDDLTGRLRMVPAAPELDALAAAEVPPAWDGRIGTVVDFGDVPPLVPVIRDVVSGMFAPEGKVEVYMVPAVGSAPVRAYDVQHRVAGTTPWNTVVVLVSSSVATLDGYATGEAFQVRARAHGLMPDDLVSAYGAVEDHVVGEDDPGVLGVGGGKILGVGLGGTTVLGVTAT